MVSSELRIPATRVFLLTTWLSTWIAFEGGSNSWTVTPDLNRTDADVSIVAIAPNAIKFDEMVDDPVFAAHEMAGSYINDQGANVTWYGSDYW